MALAVQDVATAIRWLDRAHRLLPTDPNVMLSLASACLDEDPAKAATLFRRVAEQHDVRQAWLGLAAAWLRLAGPAAAAEPLAAALSRHALAPDMRDAGLAGGRTAVRCGLVRRRPATAPSGCARRTPPWSIYAWTMSRLRGRTAAAPDWSGSRRLEVTIDGQPALGSPIRVDRIRRLVGCVEV